MSALRIHGQQLAKFTDMAKAYLQRFTFQIDDEEEFILEDAVKAEIVDEPDVMI